MTSTSSSNPLDEEPITAHIVVEDPFSLETKQSTTAGNSYSLLLLFYLTTLSAIVAATCRLAAVGSLWTFNAFIQAWFGFTLLGIVFGTMAAFVTVPSAKSISMGLVSAVLIGCIGSLISLIEPTQFQNLALVVPAGCLLLVFIALTATRDQ